MAVAALPLALWACAPNVTSAPKSGDAQSTDAHQDATVRADAPAIDAKADASSDASADVGVVPWSDAGPFALPGQQPCPVAPGANDPLAKLLAALGLDRTVGIKQALIQKFGGNIASDPQRLPHFHPVQEDLDGLGACWSNNLASAADAVVASDHPMTGLLAVVAHALGRSVLVGRDLPQLAPQQPLLQALKDLHGVAGEPFDEAAVAAQLQQVPLAVQVVAAKVVFGAQLAAVQRDAWLDAVGPPNRRKAWFQFGAGMLIGTKGGAIDPDQKNDANMFLLNEHSDLLVRGAAILLQTLDEADLQSAKSSQPFHFAVTTPLGRVILNGGGNDTWDPKAPDTQGDVLLALDTGGNDTWLIRAGANTSVANPIAVAIDLAGDDTYTYATAPNAEPFEALMLPDEDSRTVLGKGHLPASSSVQSRQGAGRLGVGVLVDLGGGRDHYSALRMSQGFANFGVGVQWDDGGDDTYLGESAVQASAAVGIAISYDGGGNDVRTAVHMSQGFAWIASGALLYDRSGHDSYTCSIDKPLAYPSPQTPGYANSSLCQGTGFGMRRDTTKTHRSGGIGLLRDLSGNDTYVGSTFVQGTGYWFGTGILADGNGDDHYDGLFYAQGAAAHFALAFFLDGGGNDEHGLQFKPLHSQMGLGHDFSSALFVADGGDDIYSGPSRSQGASKCHGHGLFVDNGGNDIHEANDDKAMGWATDYDWAPGVCGKYEVIASWGFFVDVGGSDAYNKPGKQMPKSGKYGDDQLWVTDDPDEPTAKEQSGGIDVLTGDTGISVKRK